MNIYKTIPRCTPGTLLNRWRRTGHFDLAEICSAKVVCRTTPNCSSVQLNGVFAS
jgi:hypothetical protein